MTPEANSKGVNTLFGVTPTYAMPIETPVPLPNDPLYDYRVVIAQTGVLAPTFDATEVAAIHTGVYNTGEALRLQFGEPGQSGAEVFREVMLDPTNGYTEIHFAPNGDLGTYCTTTAPVPGSEIMGRIVCLRDNVLTEYTVVHELGHVFSARTNFDFWVDKPFGENGDPTVVDALGTPIFGKRGYVLAEGSKTDWQRSNVISDNGWGSAAVWEVGQYWVFEFPSSPLTPTPFPLYIPKLGRCGNGAPPITPVALPPYDFQQNPCTFPDWLGVTPAHETETNEAAADLFLNWVYRKNGASPSGFLDKIWRGGSCYPNGCVDPGASGQTRFAWMNTLLPTLVAPSGR